MNIELDKYMGIICQALLWKTGRWAIAIDPCYISKAGKKAPHIGRFWSGCAQSEKMGTTMTFLMLHKEGATIAHVGDSRVYQIRPLKNEDRAEFIFQTEDHSLVNDLIKIGELTPEEAENYPRKNVITRALQPHLEHRYKADIVTLKDIRPNDFFYMCSDGMLEEASNANLCFMLNQQKPEEELIKMLVLNSQHNRDNHSAHLIHILDVENNNRSKRYTWKIKHFLKETYYVVKNTLMK